MIVAISPIARAAKSHANSRTVQVAVTSSTGYRTVANLKFAGFRVAEGGMLRYGVQRAGIAPRAICLHRLLNG